MSAVLPHYQRGPWNKQVSALTYGGQFVVPNTITAGTTDLTVVPAPGAIVAAATGVTNVMGIAGTDANVISTQTGAANTYGQPLIDISVLTDYTAVYSGGWDIWCWYGGAAAEGEPLVIGTGTSGNTVNGCVVGIAHTPFFTSTAITSFTPATIVGRCTHPGGVSAAMLTQQIGGQGSAYYFLGRVRVF